MFAFEEGRTDDLDESTSTGISADDAAACAIIADVFGGLISGKSAGKKGDVDALSADALSPNDLNADDPLTIAVGMDARPTGPAIAEVMIKTFTDAGFEVRYTGISAAPELMAWVKTSDDIDGFAYISASHNPVGHNGFKFGFADGAVLGGDISKEFISKVTAAAVDEDYFNKYCGILDEIRSSDFTLPEPSADKAEAEVAYRLFSNHVITAQADEAAQKPVLDKIRTAAAGIGIVGELNGSARGAGIDQEYFENLGMKTLFLNDEPGQIVHRIVPEGASLDLCRAELEKAHAEDPAFILGYVPDNDGDRGNIVYYNERTRCAEILEAQEVFALSVLSELIFMNKLTTGGAAQAGDAAQAGGAAQASVTGAVNAGKAKLAIAVNGPTSMRIERIAEAYGAEVFRAEVGEANVVNLAALKRAEGFEVRILGEGSNGGNITHPATVRDPLNTVFALVKLLVFGGFSSITEAVESLPAFTTTSAYEPEAQMQIGSISHAALKANYESSFPEAFESRKKQLNDAYGITGWYEINYEGTAARKGIGKEYRSGRETGGLKIVLTGPSRSASGAEVLTDKAFLWMRGSGTEPVFRVMTDIEGNNPEAMQELLRWQRKMVSQAAGLE